MKTESHIAPPAALLKINAFPKEEGAPCIVVIFDKVEGPLTRVTAESEEVYYTYDRYEIPSVYSAGLEKRVEASHAAWVEKGKELELAEKAPTEMEKLQTEVRVLRASNKELSATVDELVVASLEGGGGLV